MDTIQLQFSIPNFPQTTRRDLDEMILIFSKVAPIALEHQALRRKDRIEEFVDLFLKDVPMRSVDMRVAKLQARALERVFTGTEWLTAEQVGEMGGHGTVNPAAAPQRWKEKGQIFALRRERRDMYPRYALADDFTPVPALKKILTAFGESSSARVAAWFESTSSTLDGRRPRELLATDPDRVIEAAKATLAAEREPA